MFQEMMFSFNGRPLYGMLSALKRYHVGPGGFSGCFGFNFVQGRDDGVRGIRPTLYDGAVKDGAPGSYLNVMERVRGDVAGLLVNLVFRDVQFCQVERHEIAQVKHGPLSWRPSIDDMIVMLFDSFDNPLRAIGSSLIVDGIRKRPEGGFLKLSEEPLGVIFAQRERIIYREIL
jgi:hypothetical protein